MEDKIFKGRIKDINSRAITLAVVNTAKEEKDIIVYNKEMQGKDSFVTTFSHPDVFLTNEIDIHVSKILTNKEKLLTGDFVNRFHLEDFAKKYNSVKEGDVVSAIVSRIETEYVIKQNSKEHKDILIIIDGIRRLSLDSITENKIIGALESLVGQEFNSIYNTMIMAQDILKGPDFKDERKLCKKMLRRVLNNKKRFFATIVDDELFGMEIAFIETEYALEYGSLVYAVIDQKDKNKLRASVIATFSKKEQELGQIFDGDKIFFNDKEYSALSAEDKSNLMKIGFIHFKEPSQTFIYTPKYNYINLPNLHERRLLFLMVDNNAFEGLNSIIEKFLKTDFKMSFISNGNSIRVIKDNYHFVIFENKRIIVDKANALTNGYDTIKENEVLLEIEKILKRK